jgi:hypothetical protein
VLWCLHFVVTSGRVTTWLISRPTPFLRVEKSLNVRVSLVGLGPDRVSVVAVASIALLLVEIIDQSIVLHQHPLSN